MSKKGVKIQLKDIQVNKENFRHSPLNNELEAIHYLITEDYEAYLNLAKEIQKDCRTFTALMLEKNGNRILMDANRRISVLKIFENPKLIPEGNDYDILRNMCIAHGPLGISEIFCDIYYDSIEEDRENLMEALNELHIKDNKTKKDWNALSQYRASQFIGSSIKHPWIKTLEYYGFTDEQIIQMTYKKTDIFNRIIRKGQLKILENGKINLQNDNIIISKICEIVKNKAYYIGDSVQTVDTRTKTPIYRSIIDDLIKTYSLGQISINFSEEKDTKSNQNLVKPGNSEPEQIELDIDESNPQISKNKNDEHTRDISNFSPLISSKQRTTIISTEQKEELSSTGNPSIDRVALELSLLKISNIHIKEIDGFLISGTLLLRTFLQYCFEWYCDQNDISYSSGLEDTIKKVSEHMFNKKSISKEQKDTIKKLVKKDNIINILNDTVHNYDSSINRTLLCDFYDSVHPLVKNIYK